jgi:hypothetical protein
MPGCEAAAECRAPKDRTLQDYYAFCQEHAADYNAAWDYFAGLSAAQVAAELEAGRHAGPTWRHGAGADEALERAAGRMREAAEIEARAAAARAGPQIAPHSPEAGALAVMGLELPLTLESIRARYRDLAKRWHPDRNPGNPEAAQILKKINMAHTVLRAAWGRWEAIQALRARG